MNKAALRRQSRVRDVMTEAVVFLRTGHTLDEAWAVLHDGGISGAPVLDDRGRLAGVVSKADLADPRRFGAVTVEDIMTRVVYAVRADDSVTSAVRLMIAEKIHRVIVVNGDGTLAGIVVPIDILRALARGVLVPESVTALEFVDLGRLG